LISMDILNTAVEVCELLLTCACPELEAAY